MSELEMIEFAQFDHAIYQQHIAVMEAAPRCEIRAVWTALAGYYAMLDWQARGRPFVAADDEVIEDEAVEDAQEGFDYDSFLEQADLDFEEYRLDRRRGWAS